MKKIFFITIAIGLFLFLWTGARGAVTLIDTIAPQNDAFPILMSSKYLGDASTTADQILISNGSVFVSRPYSALASLFSVLDGSGTAGQFAYFTDSNTLSSSSTPNFSGTGTSTFAGPVTAQGRNLIEEDNTVSSTNGSLATFTGSTENRVYGTKSIDTINRVRIASNLGQAHESRFYWLTADNATSTNFAAYNSARFGSSATSTFSSTGALTVTGLDINSSSTTTSNVGFNITAGCYAVNNICVGGGGGGTIDGSGTAGKLAAWSDSDTLTATSTYFIRNFVSTIGTSATTTTRFEAPQVGGITIDQVRCRVNAGTAGFRLGDGTNYTAYTAVSTTYADMSTASNNTFTALEDGEIQVGTAAGGATFIYCTYRETIT